MKKYAIIVDENNEKRVVPSKWMMNNNSTLLWPPYKNTEKIRRAILQLEDPSEDWEDYQVDFIKSKDDYVEAVAEIKANLDELSGGSDAEKMKKSRARRKKISYQGLGDYSGAVADAEMKADSDVPSSESDVERIKIPKSRGKTSFFENRNKSISIDSRDSETDEHDETLKNTDENTSKSLPSSLSLCMSPQVQNGPTVADTQIDEQLNSERDILFSMHGMLKKIMTSIHALSMKQDRLEGRLRQLESRGLINNTVASVTSSFMVNDAIVKRFPIVMFLCYGINSFRCNSSYIGQTKQLLSNRIKQHIYSCNTHSSKDDDNKTALVEHHINTGHIFNFKDVTIEDSETNYRKRTISEMIHIKANDTTNKRTDTQNLSRIYNILINKYKNKR
ncbi:uncharacterized protein LOC123313186 [Coccinella septempunctata]|uniref:uncharacterized protein LOC123313186 n=1 Tax=Coccinella septempunctata TaxID=41139 RepID=UPI001D065572|nr:uncharacterized protein LOC123313186 [Coccinella septempunctata]